MTVEELLEIEEIKNLRHAYSHAFDGKDIDALMDLFAPDAVCEFGAAFGGDWVGQEVIRKNFSRYAAAEGEPFGVLHAVTNPWIRIVDAQTAHGRWYLLDLNTTQGVDNPLILFGIYDDVYNKAAGRWKIARTRIDFLWPRREVSAPRDLQSLSAPGASSSPEG